VHKVSIIPRGIGALGYTIQRPTEDRFLMSREELENKMAVLLGGRAAEWVVFGNLTTGAADDLRRVTDLARSMVTRYGMSTVLGPIAYDQERGSMLGSMQSSFGYPEQRDYGEVTATTIDDEVRSIVRAAFDRTVALLKERREVLEIAARRLLEKETLNEHELLELVGTKLPMAGSLRLA
jgi:cell division protease FtsH